MGNCLLTEYKSVVNNDALGVYGEFKIILTREGDTAGEGLIMKGGGIITTSNAINVYELTEIWGELTNLVASNVTSFSVVDNNKLYAYVPQVKGDTTLKASDKYSITLISNRMVGNKLIKLNKNDLSVFNGLMALTRLQITSSGIKGDISNLGELTSLSILEFDLDNVNMYGDISSLKELTALTRIDFNTNTKIVGEVKALGGMSLLTRIGLNGSGVSGSMEDLVSAWRISKGTSGNVTASYVKYWGTVTLGGVKMTEDENIPTNANNIAWTSSTITIAHV
jgi:hypothetical protein